MAFGCGFDNLAGIDPECLSKDFEVAGDVERLDSYLSIAANFIQFFSDRLMYATAVDIIEPNRNFSVRKSAQTARIPRGERQRA